MYFSNHKNKVIIEVILTNLQPSKKIILDKWNKVTDTSKHLPTFQQSKRGSVDCLIKKNVHAKNKTKQNNSKQTKAISQTAMFTSTIGETSLLEKNA